MSEQSGPEASGSDTAEDPIAAAYPVAEDEDDRRPTAVRFVGGLEHRVENLTAMLEFVSTASPTTQELRKWFFENTSSSNVSTFEKHVGFVEDIELIQFDGETYVLAPDGAQYLQSVEEAGTGEYDVLFDVLNDSVIGFDYLLTRLDDDPIPLDRRHSVLEGAYIDYEPAPDVAPKHYTWLQVVEYVDLRDGEYVLTSRGARALQRIRGSTWSSISPLSERGPSRLRERATQSESLAPRDTDFPTEITYSVDLSQITARRDSHEARLDELQTELERADYECYETKHSDLLAVRDDRVVVVEAKTLESDTALSLVRGGIGQLFEYEYFTVRLRGQWDDRSIVRCLYVTPPPTGSFESYLTDLPKRGIEVLWLGEDGIDGPSRWLLDQA